MRKAACQSQFLPEILLLAAVVLVRIAAEMTEFTLERQVLHSSCELEAPVIGCDSEAVTSSSANWVRWLLSLTNLSALAVLPIFAAASDSLKKSGGTRLPLLAVQSVAVGLLPMLYYLHHVGALPQWMQLLIPTSLALFGSELNVIMPTLFAARADLFRDDETGDTARGSAFLRVEIAMHVGGFVGASLAAWLLRVFPSDEQIALHMSFIVAALCGWSAGAVILMLRHLESAKRTASDVTPCARPPLVELALGSYSGLFDAIRDGLKLSTETQRGWVSLTVGSFAMVNGNEGMVHINTIIWARIGFSGECSAVLYAISRISGVGHVLLAMGLMRCVGRVEPVILVMACVATVAPLAFAVGIMLSSRALVLVNATLFSAFGPVVILTRSLVVLYSPAERLGTALCLLGMLDELVTGLGNFTMSTIFALTAGAPSVVAWLTTVGWLVIVELNRRLVAFGEGDVRPRSDDDAPSLLYKGTLLPVST